MYRLSITIFFCLLFYQRQTSLVNTNTATSQHSKSMQNYKAKKRVSRKNILICLLRSNYKKMLICECEYLSCLVLYRKAYCCKLGIEQTCKEGSYRIQDVLVHAVVVCTRWMSSCDRNHPTLILYPVNRQSFHRVQHQLLAIQLFVLKE